MDVLTTQTLSGVQMGIEVAGTVAFALSGVIEAARKKLDAVGVCAVACVAATTLLRLAALQFEWRLPSWKTED